jgi:hemolysin III
MTAVEATSAGETHPRPRFRGRIHQVAFIVSIPAGMLLVALGRSASARAATAVYAISLAAMLGTSASYHRYPWSPAAHQRMRRLDHSMIFLLIAGTYTPFSVLALHDALRVVILAVAWTGAIVGIALKQLQLRGVRAATSVGAIVLLRRRPDPSPTVFGYHEIWHVFVTSAVLCHYVAILLMLVAAG